MTRMELKKNGVNIPNVPNRQLLTYLPDKLIGCRTGSLFMYNYQVAKTYHSQWDF